MANICDSRFALVFDEPGAAQEMKDTLQQLDKQGWNIRLCELAEKYGIDYEKEHISVRGSIYYFDLDAENNVLTIETESAWVAPVELFDAISEKLGGTIQVNFRAVECGCEYFVVRDSGDFFPEECLVSCSGKPFDDDGMEEPFESVYDAIQFWCEKMSFNRDGRSDDEMRQLIEEFEYEDEDAFFYIYDFDFE